VKSQCVPFSQIPHSSRLFLDFLSGAPSVQRFYPRSARFDSWFREAASGMQYNSARRKQVAAVLEEQNTRWNASATVLQNISRLRAGAAAVVTGQQVGLFGGPLFVLFKAITAVKLAAEASYSGIDCVPVFWLATEDHDLAEVNHASIPGPDGALQKLTTESRGIEYSPVVRVSFGNEISAAVQSARELLGESEITDCLGEAYRPGENFGSAFARLLARIFGELGVILLDPSDPELHRMAQPLYRRAIEQAPELNEACLARGRALEGASYHQQVKVTGSSTLLFAVRDGARIPIQQRTNGAETFSVGRETIPRADLLAQVDSNPQDFSPNVLLRPVVQDYLLPTLAYAGGPAEIAYFAQAGVVYEALLGKTTPIVHRFSATIVPEKSSRLIERYKLNFTDLLHGPEKVREIIGQRMLPQHLQEAFEKAENGLAASLTSIHHAVAALDLTLAGAAEKARNKMIYQLNKLRSRAGRAELHRNEIVSRHAEFLSATLFPNKALQEREVAGIYFLAQNGVGLLGELYEAFHTDCLDHQVISL